MASYRNELKMKSLTADCATRKLNLLRGQATLLPEREAFCRGRSLLTLFSYDGIRTTVFCTSVRPEGFEGENMLRKVMTGDT